MGDIRKQSILSSILIYMGFAVGALNNYLLAGHDFFSPDENGMVQSIMALNLVFFSFANLGATTIMSRFYPFYNENLPPERNDLLTLAFLLGVSGFLLTILGAYVFEPLFIRKFSEHAQPLVRYYYWILLYTFFYLIFAILETQSAIHKKTIFANFLRETGSRIWLTIIIILYIFKVISYDLLIKLFMFAYGVASLALIIFLHNTRRLHFSFRISSVTKKLFRKMLGLVWYILLGNIIFNLAQNMDSLLLTSQIGLTATGIYMLSKYISSIVSVPMRSIVSIAIPYLSQAWKDSNFPEINRIYTRSAINLLLISLFIFINIWLNLDYAYNLLKIDEAYQAGKYIILVLGIGMIIDMSTGINGHMLYVSPIWRFEFWNGIIVLSLSLPVNYFLVKNYGAMGAAWTAFSVIVITNVVRTWYIYYVYKIQPFSRKTILAVVLAICCYIFTYYVFRHLGGWLGMFCRLVLFSGLFIGSTIYFDVTPDLKALWLSGISRLPRNKKT